MSSSTKPTNHQTIVVMRHGDRMDNFEPLWITTARRPWDPPLVEDGKVRAFCTGQKLKMQLPRSIDRVFVSPFLRCVQTAAEVVKALCSVDDDPKRVCSDGVVVDPTKLKVSFEHGLCEMMNSDAIRNGVAPKDGKFTFNFPELEAILPAGILDHSVEQVYKEPPQWEEHILETNRRYQHVIQTLADKYPSENLLLVTHGQCVGATVSAYLNDVTVYEVDYCAYARLRRPIFEENPSLTTGNFELLTDGQIGIAYLPPSSDGET